MLEHADDVNMLLKKMKVGTGGRRLNKLVAGRREDVGDIDRIIEVIQEFVRARRCMIFFGVNN